MLEILTRNYNFRNKSARLYELGRVYFKRPDGLADEPKVLTLGAYGGGMDFFALKGAVEAVLKQLRVEDVRFLADRENPSYHPGRCARVYCCLLYTSQTPGSALQRNALLPEGTGSYRRA